MVLGGVELGAGVDGQTGRVDLFSAVPVCSPDNHDVGQFRLCGIGQVDAQTAQWGGQTLRSERQHPGPGVAVGNVLGGCAAGGNKILVADSDSLGAEVRRVLGRGLLRGVGADYDGVSGSVERCHQLRGARHGFPAGTAGALCPHQATVDIQYPAVGIFNGVAHAVTSCAALPTVGPTSLDVPR